MKYKNPFKKGDRVVITKECIHNYRLPEGGVVVSTTKWIRDKEEFCIKVNSIIDGKITRNHYHYRIADLQLAIPEINEAKLRKMLS